MKLVDADALKDALFQKHIHDGEELEPILYLDDAMKVVDEAPTVDAVPVVHAYWIDCSEGNDGIVCRKCSACKDMQIHYRAYYPNFCHECGAKMDGERRDGDGTD